MAGSERSSAARFLLTRTAALVLRDIHRHSRREWGDAVADSYIFDLYAVMRRAAENPALGRLRHERSAPFLMLPARKHFVIYDAMPQGVVILTVQHQVRDIEALIKSLTPVFLAEIMRIRDEAAG